MPSRQYVFFDLGWTLEDETKAQIDRAEKAAAAAAEHGVRTTAQRILALQEVGAAKFVPNVFPYALAQLGLDTAQVQDVQRQASWDKSLLSLYPDAEMVLDRLGETHFLGLIANQSPGTEARLRAYGIYDRFGLVFASAELGLEKPDPRIFALALERAGGRPDRAWMIGDRLDNDIKPARVCGWHTVRVLQGYNAKQTPRDDSERPEHTVSQISEVLDILA